MHGPINVKSPNNTSKWQMGFNSEFKGLTFHSTPPAGCPSSPDNFSRTKVAGFWVGGFQQKLRHLSTDAQGIINVAACTIYQQRRILRPQRMFHRRRI
jgi:hypothetical protein